MFQSFFSRAALIVLSTTLAVLGVACREDKQTTSTGGNEPPLQIEKSTAPSPNKNATSISLQPKPQKTFEVEPSSFELGLDKAEGALTISRSAQSADDWKLVASQYQDAIALMKKVQPESPYFAIAQKKITQYQGQVKYAQRQATLPSLASQATPKKIVVVTPQASPAPKQTPPPLTAQQQLPPPLPILPSSQPIKQQRVFTAPITRRIGRTPVIKVTFNGNQQFEMILDTGASGTVITQQMATALRVVPVGKAKANTATSKAVEFPVGYVNSMEVAGAKVNKIAVAIAGTELQTGLLGHDFFGNYDITLKRDVVEFRPQLHNSETRDSSKSMP